jgi:alpha-mannosidase
MKEKNLYLICNAHLDPVWLWKWEEGAGEALSTFRTAAQLCEEFDEFVFCHNEALLYQWIEAYEQEKKVAHHGWVVCPAGLQYALGGVFCPANFVGKDLF